MGAMKTVIQINSGGVGSDRRVSQLLVTACWAFSVPIRYSLSGYHFFFCPILQCSRLFCSLISHVIPYLSFKIYGGIFLPSGPTQTCQAPHHLALLPIIIRLITLFTYSCSSSSQCFLPPILYKKLRQATTSTDQEKIQNASSDWMARCSYIRCLHWHVLTFK